MRETIQIENINSEDFKNEIINGQAFHKRIIHDRAWKNNIRDILR